MIKEFTVGRLKVTSINDRNEMAKAAAFEIQKTIESILLEKDEVNIIFASSPYLLEVFDLMSKSDIPFEKINAFHMDEYIGISIEHQASFAHYIRDNLFDKVRMKQIFYIDGMNNPQEECNRYAELLKQYPVDITLLGIGTNGHLAFNDPYIADFFDTLDVKVNPNMDDTCREQQVQDGWFKSVADIPQASITITIPALLRAPYTFTIVPGKLKMDIVKKVVEGPICLEVPATSLRLHKCSRLFIDAESSTLITGHEV